MGIGNRKALLPWAVPFALVAALATPAGAQEPARVSDTAEALFVQGKQLLDSGATEEACDRFSESQRIEPAVGTLGMLAFCHETQGRIATAWREYLATAELALSVGDRLREKAARDRASSLQGRLSTVRVEVPAPEADLTITLSGAALSRSEWGKATPVDPGQIAVRACAPEHECWESTVDVKGDSLLAVVEIPSLRMIHGETPQPAPPPARSAPPRDKTWVPPAVAGGVAVLGLGLGTYFGVRTISKTNQSDAHCDASNACDLEGGRLRDEARTSSRISNVSFGIAVAATAAGVVLWLRRPAPQREASRSASLSVSPTVGVSSAGLSLGGAF